jgi:signal-transduction protein with cAMP-binding, CBS, and nucleotidyltransferase domain
VRREQPTAISHQLLFIFAFRFKPDPTYMRTVKQILDSKPDPNNIISPDTLVIDALNQLNTVNLSYLVVKEGAEYKGVFSERDYSRNVILKGRTSNTTPVKEVMTTDLPVVRLSDTVEHCMNMMNENRTRYLLAFDAQDRFAGVVTIHDLMRQVIANREDVFDSAARRWLEQDESGHIY